MSWNVEFTDEFGEWWESLTERQQTDVAVSVELLRQLGPNLGFPHSSGIVGSEFPNMRELRSQSGGHPLRTLYAFNPLRTAILLIGGDKTGDDRWYATYVPKADAIYQRHLEELRARRE